MRKRKCWWGGHDLPKMIAKQSEEVRRRLTPERRVELDQEIRDHIQWHRGGV